MAKEGQQGMLGTLRRSKTPTCICTNPKHIEETTVERLPLLRIIWCLDCKAVVGGRWTNVEEQKKTTYQRRKEQGQCPQCTKKPKKGHVLCKICLEIMRDNGIGRTNVRNVLGVCVRCGGKRDNNKFKSCDDCRKRSNRLRLARERREREPHIEALIGQIEL